MKNLHIKKSSQGPVLAKGKKRKITAECTAGFCGPTSTSSDGNSQVTVGYDKDNKAGGVGYSCNF